MSWNASLLFDEVETALAASSANPALVFAGVAEVTLGVLEGPPPAGLLTQTYVQAGVLGLELFAMAASIGCRVWLGRRSRWLFERRQTRFGTYIAPNASFT